MTILFPDGEFFVRFLSIIAIDLMLAGDNALIIALAVRNLPKRQQWLGRIWGTVGAAALRILFIFAATLLLEIPFLQLAGGVLLIWIALRLVRSAPEASAHTRAGTTLWDAIRIIIVADAVMSLDNVLAVAAAARGSLSLVAFGVALSLPLVVWGSGLLAWLMERFPWIIWIGGGILGYVGSEMILDDRIVQERLGGRGILQLLPISVALVVTAMAWFFSKKSKRN